MLPPLLTALTALLPFVSATKPQLLNIKKLALHQCPDFDVSYIRTSVKPASGFTLLYTPKDNASIARYGPDVPSSENERRCLTVVDFLTLYDDTTSHTTEQLRVGSLDVTIPQIKLEKGVSGSIKSFLNWGGVGRQNLTQQSLKGPIEGLDLTSHQRNTSIPLDAVCQWDQDYTQNQLWLWTYFTLGSSDSNPSSSSSAVNSASATLSGAFRVAVNFVWKDRCSQRGDVD